MEFGASRETQIIAKFCSDYGPEQGRAKVLDVGCGFGRNIASLTRNDFRVTGVDVNREAVEHNRSLGFECYLPDEPGWKHSYDILLMSHIIEHFSPGELLPFIERHLIYLRPGGAMIIATPLLTNYFFDDFTHVRPYSPESLLMVFGDVNHQVSISSSTKLRLSRLWFRTSAPMIRRTSMRYLRGPGRAAIRCLNGILRAVHTMSFGFVGKRDGWVGVFERLE